MSPVLIAALIVAIPPARPVDTDRNGSADSTETQLVAVAPSFIVHSFAGGPKAIEVAKLCGSLRRETHAKWLGDSPIEQWVPRCQIVLYASRKEYGAAVGRGAERTSGSSLIQFEQDRIVTRRVDLLVDQQGRISALPHELTHVVLADRFGSRQPPLWADEGIATLADTREKRSLHERDCDHALRSGTALHVYDLMTLDRFTSSQQVAAFYGQSVSLVRFLSERDEPSKFLPFVQSAMDHGYDRALRQTYGIDGVGHLQRLWRDDTLLSRRKLSVPVIEAGIKR